MKDQTKTVKERTSKRRIRKTGDGVGEEEDDRLEGKDQDEEGLNKNVVEENE